MNGSTELSLSPLDAVHRSAGARMVPFGGWEMPLNYPAGTIAEHLACRSGVALFDVSHLGSLEVSGEEAFELLQTAFTNDLRRIGPGRAQYTHLLAEADASVVDDIIVWWLEEQRFIVLPNAANNEGVVGALPGCADVAPDRALLALQGPASRSTLEKVSPEAAGVARFRVSTFEWDGELAIVAGTGYTGEEGFELSLPNRVAASMWAALAESGAEQAGLGARDTLRLEAGLPLHGHELGPGISPLDAGLGWVVGWDKENFTGRDAIVALREAGPTVRLCGLSIEGRRPPREGQAVFRNGAEVAAVTSGNFSPTLGHGIAMAFLPADVVAGDFVTLDQRGTEVSAVVVELPFL